MGALFRRGTLGYTRLVSRLVVNADDFGYTAGINRAVFSLYASGALSSATAMARGAALPAGWSAPAPGERPPVGCHVVLVDGRPAADAGAVPSLLEGDRFRPTLGRFVADLLRGRIREAEIEIEAVAQIRLLQARGFGLTHLDTHKHTHMFPRVLRPLVRAARQCGIGAVRNPFEPEWARAATVIAGAGAPLVRRLEVALLAGYRAGFVRDVERAGLRTSAGALGVLATGVLRAPVLEALLAALEKHGAAADCYELVCHPGFHDAALEAARTRLRGQREVERAALLEVMPRWTGAEGPHRLVSFADL